MGVGLNFAGESFGVQIARSVENTKSQVAKAMTSTAREAAALILSLGRANIKGAGKFGARWTEGLKATIQPNTGALTNVKITITHDVPYFMVFERGKVIHGNPLLWIPLSYTGITVRARDFPGSLVRTTRKSDGLPLLIGGDGQAKYFGKESVTIPKKFFIEEICKTVMDGFAAQYSSRLGRI